MYTTFKMIINLPKFNYLESMYIGGYMHQYNNMLFCLQIKPESKFNDLLHIKEIYNDLNKFIHVFKPLRSVKNEIINTEYGDFQLPLPCWKIFIGKEEVILTPEIIGVKISQLSVLDFKIFTIIIDFTKFLNKLYEFLSIISQVLTIVSRSVNFNS